MLGPEIDRLIQLLAKMPGLGPRSARRAALHMLKHKDRVMLPLAEIIGETARRIDACSVCGNLDSQDPCTICRDPTRNDSLLCVIEDVADLWALERAAIFRGRYHVLGGVLSALEGIGPEDLDLDGLVARVDKGDIQEVILATNATVDGQATAHYISDRLSASGVQLTRLARGVPLGGELDYLDDGTLAAALGARLPID
jgi:recombination protein RecR